MRDDFCEALAELARRKGRKGVDVGDDEGRLMPRSNQVLAGGRVHASLATD